MDSNIERYHSKSEFYYPDEDFRHVRPFYSNPVEKVKTLFPGQGRSVLGKTVSVVSSTARGLYSFSHYRPSGWQITYMYGLEIFALC